MQTMKVGIREFRENLAAYLESEVPVAVTRHGETIGVTVPTRHKPMNHDWTTLPTALALGCRGIATTDTWPAQMSYFRSGI